MEVRLRVKLSTDISLIEAQYGELSEPFLRNDGDEDLVDYYLGYDDEDDDDGEWLNHDEAVGFCGFCDGLSLIPSPGLWGTGNGNNQ